MKEPSAAQLAARAKFGQQAKERAAKKRAEKENDSVAPTPSVPNNNDVDKLWAYIKELEGRVNLPPAQNPVAVRQITKYSINPKDYPDPRERLFGEQRLKTKNFIPEWWALEWTVDKVNYDKDGVKYIEPRFELQLWHIMEDDEGNPSNKRYKVCTGMFFEDPDSFIAVAHEQGKDVPEEIYQDFMDEMRYMIVRDWLLECFYPPKPTQNKTNRTETVIGNRVVEVVEINSPEAQNAFAHLKSKA